MNVGYNTKQFGVADDDQDIDMDYNQRPQVLNMRLMERDKRNDIKYRAKNCKWTVKDPHKKSGEDWQHLMQKLSEDVCCV